MTATSAGGGTREQGRSEYGVALFLGALGLLVVVSALLLPESRITRGPVGPAAVPIVVGGLLVVTSVFLAVDVRRGGRGEPEGGEDVDLTARSDWRTVGLLAAAFVANALLIESLGWVISGAVLFWGSAFALGSRHYVRDLLIAVGLSVGSFYLFALGLGIVLPPGILRGIL
ncbi:tripartite tricarboxylate transporter TctB family protein [Geodermatophilus sp. YIM 151500]|uniref:tripartite tricarboxylate transporter TctB family protein n=1 Tax=Geodermatophilus sp. YIM 151500 TaxID=2984531 RepID=UPI0021E4DEE3|nr:tripartite tricarboxylate transporter TctB family protein [Geodermatophilus sp. YIM 151500]MCV2488151.1 tripartite tricarboxylate transporter TctB family protein [Geodermatophilus sp. YIM 151500]